MAVPGPEKRGLTEAQIKLLTGDALYQAILALRLYTTEAGHWLNEREYRPIPGFHSAEAADRAYRRLVAITEESSPTKDDLSCCCEPHDHDIHMYPCPCAGRAS